jgi:hypothetical protein
LNNKDRRLTFQKLTPLAHLLRRRSKSPAKSFMPGDPNLPVNQYGRASSELKPFVARSSVTQPAETPMPPKKRKGSPTSKSKTKKPTSKPLLAATGAVRRAKLAPRSPVRTAAHSPGANNSAVTMINLMGHVMTAYAELPYRLAKCRSPMDLWLEQVRFAQRFFIPTIST